MKKEKIPNLKYKDGNMNFYEFAKVTEGGITATVLIVPSGFFDNHCKQSIEHSLPIFATAISKNHPDYKYMFDNTFKPKENLILIRDQIYKLANIDELQAIIEHEYGHLFFEYHGEILSRYDYQEQLADIFVDDYEKVYSLEKKWALYNEKSCKRCKTKLILEEKEIKNHWILYCPNCQYWTGDGKLNPIYVELFIKEKLNILKNTKFREKTNPILTYEEDVILTNMITKAKLWKANYGTK